MKKYAYTVLVVEDEPMTRRTLCRMLERIDCRGVEAESIEQAQEKFNAETTDLIVLDIQLRDSDGISQCAAWREAGVTVPIVICSSHNERQTVEEAIKAGATDFIIKPFQTNDVKERIARHLPKRDVPSEK